MATVKPLKKSVLVINALKRVAFYCCKTWGGDGAVSNYFEELTCSEVMRTDRKYYSKHFQQMYSRVELSGHQFLSQKCAGKADHAR